MNKFHAVMVMLCMPALADDIVVTSFSQQGDCAYNTINYSVEGRTIKIDFVDGYILTDINKVNCMLLFEVTDSGGKLSQKQYSYFGEAITERSVRGSVASAFRILGNAAPVKVLDIPELSIMHIAVIDDPECYVTLDNYTVEFRADLTLYQIPSTQTSIEDSLIKINSAILVL